MRDFIKRLKQNNKGFSLVELVVAAGILGVISLTVITVMSASSTSYQKSSTEATLQSEAQVVANAISDRLIDCNKNIDYNTEVLNTVDGLTADTFGDRASGSVLQIVNNDKKYMLLFNQDEKELYYLEANKVGNAFPKYDYSSREVLASNVHDFVVNKDRYDKEHIIWFEITYLKDGKQMKGTYQVNIRNHVTLDEGDSTDDDDEVKLQTLMVSPAETTINVIEGGVYESPEIYKYKMGTISGHDNDKIDGISNLIISSIQYSVSGKPSNAQITNLKWDLSPQEGTGSYFGEGDKVGSGYTDGNATPKLNLDADGTKITKKAFRIIASADTNVQGAAVVNVRKVTGVNVSAQSGLQSATDYNTGNKAMMANRVGKVMLNASVDGWNLEDNNRGIYWSVYYRDNVSDDYKLLKDINQNQSIATVTASGKNVALSLGVRAGLNAQFKVVATSTFDRSVTDEIEFGIKGAEAGNGNKTFARGVNIDLSAYFTTFGVDNWDVVNYYDAKLGTLPGLSEGDLANKPANISDDKSYLFFSGDPTDLRYYGKGLIDYFFGEIEAQINVDGDVVEGDGYKRKWVHGHVYFPEVKMYKTTAELLNSVHTYNETHRIMSKADLDAADLNAMENLDKNVVISKGNSKALRFYLQSYNVTKEEYIGVYVNCSDSDRGTNIAAGNAGSNGFLSASLTSALGTETKLMDNGVVTVKALSNKTVKEYPVDMIPLRICLDQYYNIDLNASYVSPDGRSYTEYNIYVANVEGTNVFIPTPASPGWDDSKFRTADAQQSLTLGPANTSVKIWKTSVGAYYMIYNTTTYVYDTTFKYWKEV